MRGRRQTQRGVTLLEILIVVAIAGLMVGITFPAVSAGLDSIRLRSATDLVATTLNGAVNRANRRLAAVEVVIDPARQRMVLAGVAPGDQREVVLPDGVTIERVLPEFPGMEPGAPRQFLIAPGGTVPRIGVELKNRRNARRIVSVEPITGVARVETVE
jgi:prepilin-type N-terminal cleavage/methylation domain-containing protein